MKKMLVIAAFSSACIGTANAGNIHTREIRQQERIAQGIRTGNLTPREVARLENNEAALHREICRDRLDGGGFTFNERQKIARQQNRVKRRNLSPVSRSHRSAYSEFIVSCTGN